MIQVRSEIDQNWTDRGQGWAYFDQGCAGSSGLMSASLASSGQTWTDFRPVGIGPKSATLDRCRPNSADLDHMWNKLTNIVPNAFSFGRIRPISGRDRPNSGRVRHGASKDNWSGRIIAQLCVSWRVGDRRRIIRSSPSSSPSSVYVSLLCSLPLCAGFFWALAWWATPTSEIGPSCPRTPSLNPRVPLGPQMCPRL